MNRKTVLLVLLAIGVGFGAGYATSWINQRQESRGIIVAHELQVIAYTANSLNSLPDRPESVSRIQLLAMESALQRLDELTVQMEGFPIPTPSLQESLNRAARYGEAHGRPDITKRATLIKNRLFAGT